MRIVGVNTLDSRGGAAKFAERLGVSLRARRHEVQMLVAYRLEEGKNTEEIQYDRWSRQLNRVLRLRGLFLPTGRVVRNHPWFQRADILHIHNLHAEPYGYFNIRDLPALSNAKPTVWTLHDPWVLHEDGYTPEYDPIFGRIPRVVSRLKRQAVNRSNVTFVVPSVWLETLVKRAYPNKPVELIPHGVDTKVFYPMDKAPSRRTLGIPMDKRVVLFVANEGELNIPKGGVFVSAARAALEADGVLFMSIGASSGGRYLHDESALATHYSAADALLLPSAAENFPLVALEAMACGTPVVAFRVGGLPTLVRHRRDGYLVEFGNVRDLIDGLSFVLNDPEAAVFGQAGAERMRRDFSMEQMTERYLRLYSIVGRP